MTKDHEKMDENKDGNKNERRDAPPKDTLESKDAKQLPSDEKVDETVEETRQEAHESLSGLELPDLYDEMSLSSSDEDQNGDLILSPSEEAFVEDEKPTPSVGGGGASVPPEDHGGGPGEGGGDNNEEGQGGEEESEGGEQPVFVPVPMLEGTGPVVPSGVQPLPRGKLAPAVSLLQGVQEYWRKRIGKNEWGAPIPTVRRIGFTGAGSLWGYLLSGLSSVKTAVFVGAGTPLGAVAASQAPILLPPLRRFVSWRKHERQVQGEFKNALWTYVDDPQDAAKKLNEYCAFDKTDAELIDTNAESLLIYAFNKSGVVHPEKMPFLGSQYRYARHCFTKLIGLCHQADAYLDAKAAGQSPMLPPSLRGLSEDELKELQTHALPLLPLLQGGVMNTAAPQQENKKLEHLLQCSAAYARLLQNRHRDQRESSVTFGTLGSSAALGILTVNPLLPGLIGGGYLLGRLGYRKLCKHGQTLEMNDKGVITSGILSPSTYEGAEKALCDQLHEVSKREELTNDEKRWLPLIQLPSSLKEKHFRSVDDMAVAAARPVLNALIKVKPFPKALSDEEKSLKRSTFEEERAKLKRLVEEAERIEDQVEGLNTQLRSQRSKIADLERTERDKDDERELRRLRGYLTELEEQVSVKEVRLKRLKGDEHAATEVGKKGLIEEQRTKAVSLQADYFKKPESEGQPMKAEDIIHNPEIQRAFAVRVHEWFEQQKERSNVLGWLGKKTAESMGGAVRGAGGAVGTRVLNAVTTGVSNGALAGAAAWAGSYYLLPSAFSSTGIGVSAAVAAGLFSGIKTLVKGRS